MQAEGLIDWPKQGRWISTLQPMCDAGRFSEVLACSLALFPFKPSIALLRIHMRSVFRASLARSNVHPMLPRLLFGCARVCQNGGDPPLVVSIFGFPNHHNHTEPTARCKGTWSQTVRPSQVPWVGGCPFGAWLKLRWGTRPFQGGRFPKKQTCIGVRHLSYCSRSGPALAFSRASGRALPYGN